jgi:hypothetical protein
MHLARNIGEKKPERLTAHIAGMLRSPYFCPMGGSVD